MTIYEMPEHYIKSELAKHDGDYAERRLELDLEALLTGPTSGEKARHLSASIVKQGAYAVVGALQKACNRFIGKHGPDKSEPWCEPWCAGLASEPRAVGKRLGELLTALGRIDSNIVKGSLANELWKTRIALHERLKAEGWRITATRDGWKVLPPVTKKGKA